MNHKDNKLFALFRRYANKHKRAIIGLTLVYIASTVLLVLTPQTLSRFIDSVHSGGAWYNSVLAIVLYLAAMLAQSTMTAVLDYQLASVGQRLTDDHRHDIMAHFMSLGAQHFGDLTSGEIITRLDKDAPGLFNYYYILFYKLAGSVLALIGILVSLSFRVGWLSSVLLVVSILAILGFKSIQDRGIPKYVRSFKASAAFNGLLKEMLDNEDTRRKVLNQLTAYLKQSSRSAIIATNERTFLEAANQILFMERGRLVSQGNFSYLMENAEFRNMVTQS